MSKYYYAMYKALKSYEIYQSLRSPVSINSHCQVTCYDDIHKAHFGGFRGCRGFRFLYRPRTDALIGLS